jgi:transcription elongation factor GreA
MSQEQFITAEGREQFQRELEELISVRRPELAEKLKEAVSQGDLKENADYHDTKEQQALVEGRITYLESVLRSAQIIDAAVSGGVIALGSSVIIVEEGTTTEETYTIVGMAEANPREGRISNVSPLGAALIGRKKGEKVTIQAPSGKLTFKIKKVL